MKMNVNRADTLSILHSIKDTFQCSVRRNTVYTDKIETLKMKIDVNFKYYTCDFLKQKLFYMRVKQIKCRQP